MLQCIKKCFSNIFQIKSLKNDVKIYNHIFIAHEKENQVFEELKISFRFNYLKFLTGFNGFVSNIYSELYNLIHDHKKMNYDLITNKMGLGLDKIISPESLEECRISDENWKKSGGDKEKYGDLMVEYYQNKN